MSDDKGRPFDTLNTRALTAKKEYVHGLEQRRDAEALSLLVECLCDESWYLRDLAERAFMRLGDDGAAVLLPLLEQGLWFTRTSAAGVLGRMGYRPAVPALLRLCEDENRTVADAAREALLTIGRQPVQDVRRTRLTEIVNRDRALAGRIEQMMQDDDLMSAHDASGLSDESPLVRASEDGVEWEVLTSPPPAKTPTPGPPTPAHREPRADGTGGGPTGA